MATLRFDLVSPDKLLFSGEVDQVDVPSVEGDFGVLAGHAPTVTTLRPGILTVHAGGSSERIVIFGGFAEVSTAGLTVLADVAHAVEDIDQALLAEQIQQVEERIATMEQGSALDREIMRLDDFRTVQQNLQATALH
jgi:F-type H+-transporting ATPase subunit epsilon